MTREEALARCLVRVLCSADLTCLPALQRDCQAALITIDDGARAGTDSMGQKTTAQVASAPPPAPPVLPPTTPAEVAKIAEQMEQYADGTITAPDAWLRESAAILRRFIAPPALRMDYIRSEALSAVEFFIRPLQNSTWSSQAAISAIQRALNAQATAYVPLSPNAREAAKNVVKAANSRMSVQSFVELRNAAEQLRAALDAESAPAPTVVYEVMDSVWSKRLVKTGLRLWSTYATDALHGTWEGARK